MNEHRAEFNQQVVELEERWATDPRHQGIKRDYTASDVVKLRGSLKVDYTLAKVGAERLWQLLHTDGYMATFGALTGSQRSSSTLTPGFRAPAPWLSMG